MGKRILIFRLDVGAEEMDVVVMAAGGLDTSSIDAGLGSFVPFE